MIRPTGSLWQQAKFSTARDTLFVKKGRVSFVFIIIFLFSMFVYTYTRTITASQKTYAATSSTLNFQGRLLSSSGNLVPDGYYNLQFKLYDGGTDGGPGGTGQANAGTNLWTESHYDSNGGTAGNDNRVRVVNGYFSVNLGSQTSFPGTINWDQELWLTMNVGGSAQTATPTYDGEMLGPSSTRTKLTAVPYAFKAESANNVTTNNTSSASTNSSSITIQSGNATGATSNSGNISLDVGTATGTTGTISIGTVNTSAITIGRSSGTQTTTIQAGTTLALNSTTATTLTSGTSTMITSGSGNIILQAQGASTIGVIQIGAGGAGSAIPDYLALDVKSTTGDPAGGAEGYMYYNTFDNKFRCYQDSAWTDCIGSAGGATDLQTAYDTDADGSDSIIALTSADDSIIFRNPASGGTDSSYVMTIDQLSTGATGGLLISSSGTGSLLKVTDTTTTSSDVFNIADGGATTLKNQTDSTTAFQIQSASGTSVLNVDTTNSQLSVRGISSYAVEGSELIASQAFNNATYWTCSGWTTSATNATHNTGNTTACQTTSSNLTVTAGKTYKLAFNYSGNTSSNNFLTLSIGGATYPYLTATGSDYYEAVVTATNTDPLIFTPGLNYDGTIDSVSVVEITPAKSVIVVKNSDDTSAIEIRSGGSGANNTYIGLGSGSSSKSGAINNTALGAYALQANTTGDDNTAIGSGALTNNTSGFYNTAIGYNSLGYNSTGYYNNAIGRNALQANTTGTYNTALGVDALLNNGTGSKNIAIGTYALSTNISGSDNIGIGYGSANSARGSGNVGLGSNSLNSTSTGAYNLGLGFNSLRSNGTGSYNTALGYNAGYTDAGFATLNNLQNASAIGAYSQVQQSDSIILGRSGSGASTTKIGIGTTAPTDLFSISPDIYDTGTAETSASATVVGSGTTWTADMVGNEFIFANGNKYTITGFTDATHMTLSASSTNASQAYRIHNRAFYVTGTGSVGIRTSTNSTTALNVQNASGSTLLNVDTTGSNLSLGLTGSGTTTINSASTVLGASAGSGLLVNNGATRNTALALTNFATGGSIGSAATTVDIYTYITVNQTTGSQTLTVPAPTVTTSGRFLYLTNVGSASFSLTPSGGSTFTVLAGTSLSLIWDGVKWTSAGSGAAFLQGGNSFGTKALLGTSDNNALQFMINGTGVQYFSTSTGDVYYGNAANAAGTAGTPNSFTLNATGSSTAGTAGATLSIKGGAGATTTTGSAGGAVRIYGGNAGGSGNNNGGSLYLTSGSATGSGTAGSVIVQPTTNSANVFQVQSAAGNKVLSVDTSDASYAYVSIGGSAGYANSELKLFQATSYKWGIGVDNTGPRGSGGFYLWNNSSGGSYPLGVGSDGGTTFKNTTNSTSGFLIEESAGADLFSVDTTNSRIRIGESTADATGVAFVLDTKNTAGDPTGVNGAMYYNSNLNKFRCYENGAWADCNSGGGSSTLQSAYDGDADGSDSIIALSSADDSLIFRNPASGGTDSSYVATIDQLSTGATGGLDIQSAGTGNLLRVRDTTATATDVLTIADGGATTFKNQTNSTTAFQVQNASAASVLVVDSTNLRVQIGSATADGTGVLLVLDTKNTSGDPTGVNGGTYYNSSGPGGYRCYSDGFWDDCSVAQLDRSYNWTYEFMDGDPSNPSTDGSKYGDDWRVQYVGTPSALTLSSQNYLYPSVDHPGVWAMGSGTTSSTGYGLILGVGSTNPYGSVYLAPGMVMKSGVAVQQTTGFKARVGITNQPDTYAGAVTAGVWWEADPATNANWRYCYGDGTAATCANSGVAITTDAWVGLQVRVTATGTGTSSAIFVIDGNQYTVSSVTIAIKNPADSRGLAPGFFNFTTNTGTDILMLDYFQLYGQTTARR